MSKPRVAKNPGGAPLHFALRTLRCCTRYSSIGHAGTAATLQGISPFKHISPHLKAFLSPPEADVSESGIVNTSLHEINLAAVDVDEIGIAFDSAQIVRVVFKYIVEDIVFSLNKTQPRREQWISKSASRTTIYISRITCWQS
jgi:hypothetical protein